MGEYVWTPQRTTQELEKKMENAFRRALGSVRYDIDVERARMHSVRESAVDALEQGLNRGGPLFARVGLGLASMGSFRPGPSLSLRDMAGEILLEFHTEGTAAFAVEQAALSAEAAAWLKARGKDEAAVNAALETAGKGFAMPDKEQFTREAAPLLNEGLSPLGNTALLGVGGLALGIVLTRSVHLGIILALIGGGLGWYQGRRRMRAKAHRLVLHLPRNLYKLLHSQWKSNVKKYADAINAAC